MSQPDEFDCATCDHRYCGEGVEGGNGNAPYKKWTIKGVGRLNRCPLPMISDDSNFYLRLHKHYKNGILPLGGGLLEQPNKFLQAMEILG